MFLPLQTVTGLECCGNQLGRCCFPISSVCVCVRASLSLSLSLSLNLKSLFTGEQIFSFFLHQPPPLQFVNNLFYFSPFNLPFYSNAHDVILFYFYFSDFLIQLSSPLEWVHNFLGFSNLYFLRDSLLFPLQLMDFVPLFPPPPPPSSFSFAMAMAMDFFFFFFPTFNFFFYWKFKLVINPSDYKPNMKVTIF
jgi:hypothetical protein